MDPWIRIPGYGSPDTDPWIRVVAPQIRYCWTRLGEQVPKVGLGSAGAWPKFGKGLVLKMEKFTVLFFTFETGQAGRTLP